MGDSVAIHSLLLRYFMVIKVSQNMATVEELPFIQKESVVSLITPVQFASKLLSFYEKSGRKNLPWQKDTTAYRVWVSEVMLQQTQVQTVIPYYQEFMLSFPTVKALAAAHIDEVLHHWQGLGYYSRARNLHQCAKTVVSEFNGEFPDNLEQMQSLSGIGRSTAGAILSLAMNKSTPILDGNVKRVLARVFLVDGWYGKAAVSKTLWQLSEKFTPQNRTANFNQAMMDLGASFCSRSKPVCGSCPLNEHCLAFIHGKTSEYPHKKPKKQIPTKQATFELIMNNNNQVKLIKRPPSGIWGGLWSLPEKAESGEKRNKNEDLIDEFKHTFTHFHLQMKFVIGNSDQKTQLIEENQMLAWHNINQLSELAFPTPIKKFLFRYFQIV